MAFSEYPNRKKNVNILDAVFLTLCMYVEIVLMFEVLMGYIFIFRQHLFYGSYEKKVSVVALAKLLQHGVNNNDTRLQVRK